MKDDPEATEGFLGRWARRKQAVQKAAAIPVVPVEDSGAVPSIQAPLAAKEPGVAVEAPPDDEGPPPPDLASIGADTDITPWLTRKVSDEWKNAALRQVWASTPAIRDFKGLQDYDWDFNNPNSIPGFGDYVHPDTVKEILANVFGQTRKPPEEEAQAEGSPALAGDAGGDPVPVAAEISGQPLDAAPEAVRLSIAEVPEVETVSTVADAGAEAPVIPRPVRRGGGALPA